MPQISSLLNPVPVTKVKARETVDKLVKEKIDIIHKETEKEIIRITRILTIDNPTPSTNRNSYTSWLTNVFIHNRLNIN